MNNILKTTLLLASLTILLMAFGQLLGGTQGMTTAFIIACLINLGAYWFSDRLVLSMYRAVPISEMEYPEVFAIVKELAAESKIPMPRIYLIPSASPNAFATGRNPNNAVIGVTQGLLELLKREELKGVLAHELGHVLNRDILISSIAATLAGAISFLASTVRWGLMLGGSRRQEEERGNPFVLLMMSLLLPIAATLIQLAVSRSREYGADESGGRLCGSPLYLASALRKLDHEIKQVPMRDSEPVTAHLFILNPLRGDAFARLFSTHPPIEERIARLEKMARQKSEI
ncbi:MAG: zinc metalloprotease HtpX [Candidatus Omnitrophica bacterium]|nr:zinc metalloprotease HtpX [Candidatus Omnitrophota bacterium]